MTTKLGIFSMTVMKTPLTIALLALNLHLSVAEDLKTVTGREYKDATISRVEPDGIVIVFSAGIVKIPFTELPLDLQKKYGYNPQGAAKFRAEVARAAAQREQEVAEAKEKQRLFNLSGLTPTPKPAPPPKHSLTLDRIAPSSSASLDRIFADYDKNQLNADQLYKGGTFTMGATIRAITSGHAGPVVEIAVPCNNACWAYAHFFPEEATQLAQFRPGNKLTFVGTIAGISGYELTIKNCYLPR